MAALPPDARIDFERHGGVAGLTLRASVTAADLTAAEADAIAGLLGGPAGEKSGRPDRFEYHLRLPGGIIVLGEAELPDVLRPLVGRLVDRARARP
jgi:hypothetical protein